MRCYWNVTTSVSCTTLFEDIWWKYLRACFEYTEEVKMPNMFSRHGVHHAPLLSVYMVIIRYRPLHRMAPYYTGLNNTKTVWRLHFMFDKKIDWYWMPCLNYKETPFINILDPFCDDTIYHNKIYHISLYAL